MYLYFLCIVLFTARECVDPGLVANALKLGTNYNVGENVLYKCNTGYQIVGSDTITCGSDGNWTPPVNQITCKGK